MGLILESTLLEGVAALVGVFTLIYYFFKYKYDYWRNKGVPFLKPEFPYGNFKDMILMRISQTEAFKKVYDQSAGLPYIGLYQLWRPLFLVNDPELLKHVLVKDFTHFHDRGITINMELDPLGQHLFMLEGRKWRNLRAKLSPTFTSGKMKFMFNLILECAQQLERQLEEPAAKGKSLEVKEISSNYTTDVIGSCVFGLQFNSLKDPKNEFREMGRKVLSRSWSSVLKEVIGEFMPWLMSLLRLKIIDKETEDFFITAIRDTIKHRELSGVTRNDFIHLLMQLKNKGIVQDDSEEHNDINNENSKLPWKTEHIDFNDGFLAAQAFIFFVAGFETSSTTISLCLYELAMNPEIQTKLHKEIDAALEQHGSFTYECIQGISYLRDVVDETLRKHPVVSMLIRKTTIAYDIPGTNVHLEKGTPVIISVSGLHQDPRYYPNPERFDPERFSDENKAKRPNYVYLPFGDGPRNCIGLRFGLLQTKVGLAVLLSKYQFSVCEKTDMKMKLDPKQFFPIPVGGIWLKISTRDDL